MKEESTYSKDNQGFKVPKNYFDSLEDTIMSKVDLKSNEEFSVPKDYFTNLEDRILDKITTKKETRVFGLRTFYVGIAVAASLVFLVSLFYKPTPPIELNKIAANDIEIWFDENIEDLDTYTLSEVVENDDIDELQSFDSDEIIEQLENSDIETILENLDSDFY